MEDIQTLIINFSAVESKLKETRRLVSDMNNSDTVAKMKTMESIENNVNAASDALSMEIERLRSIYNFISENNFRNIHDEF